MAMTASPIHSTSSSPSSPALFSTDIANNVIELKNVILNEFHVLRKFLLISKCEQALRVTLDSDLHSQIGFQLNNENIDNADGSAGADSSVTTFLADDFSELFNSVNLVSEVILQPRQIQQVIITFRPLESSEDVPHRAREFENGHQNNNVLSDQKPSKNGSVESSHKNVYSRAMQAFKVNGRLFLSAAVLTDEAQTLASSVPKTIMDRCQDIVVHFYSTVCRCILKADVSEIVFDDCVPGGVFVKDFSVWNLSEVPCGFHLHVMSGSAEQPALDLTDYDTELPVSNGELKSCSHRRIRVIYKPRDVGDCSYSIHLENCYDVQNSTCIPVHCMVNAEHRHEGLLVTGVGEDGVLDFGDCYANNGTCQIMALRNITQEALEVNLVADHPIAGDQVNFYLETEQEISNTTANGFTAFTKPQQYGLSTPEIECSPAGLSQNLGNALGTSVNVDKKSRVEVLSLKRGEEKNLLVLFYPAGASDEAKAARLQRHTFRVSLQCVQTKGRSRQRFSNIVQCKAHVCTSIAKLSTPELNFGDCNIGSTKSATFEIINLSDLPALVTSGVTSTILSFKNKAERVRIPPRQSYSVDIDLVPLKINPKYRKQITIENFHNKDNQQVLEVRAKIMDRHHVLLHSLYYKLQTPSTNNFLNFDCVVVNNPSVRTLGVENITDNCLTIGFETSMPGELSIYQLRDDLQSDIGDDTDSLFSEGSEDDEHETRKRAYAASVNKEKLLETLEESQPRLSKAIVESAPFPVQQGQKKSIPRKPPSMPVEKTMRMRMSLDLATTPFANDGGDNTTGPRSSIRGPDSVDGEGKEKLSNVEPFNVTTEVPALRMLKRVQSSALLHSVEEAPNAALYSSQDKVSPENVEEVLKRLGNLVISQCSFPDEETEKQYVENQIKDRELLVHFLEDHSRKLTPVRKLELNPGETKMLYVMLRMDPQTQPSLHGRLQKMTAKVNIQLLEYDRDQRLDLGTMEHSSEDGLLTRELPVHFKACRALLSLAQKNISFGKLLTNEHRAKTLVLHNISDVPLLYKLKKTGSIASGDLHIINGRSGILRPHTDREVNFVFQPSLGGSFHEKLVVGNVYDPVDDQLVTLKAFIIRADTFWLNTSSIDFGTVTMGEWSKPQDIVILNNSKQSRAYVLKAVDHTVDDRPTKLTNQADIPVFRFMLEEKKKQPPQRAVAPEEEAIEALERKGIALERKGKTDKAAKVRNQINQLKERLGSTTKLETMSASALNADMNHRANLMELQADDGRGLSDADADQQITQKNRSLPKGSEGYVTLMLKGGDSKVVKVSILLSSMALARSGQRVGAIVAFERKNRDVVKKVYCKATVVQRAIFEDPPGGAASDTFSLKLRTVLSESPLHHLIPQSPLVSPESSVPTSPYGSTPHSAHAENPFASSMPDLSAPLPRDNPTIIGIESASNSVPRSLTNSSQTSEADGWDFKQYVIDWSKDKEEGVSDDVSEGLVVDESESSRSESGSGLFGSDPLFKIEMLPPSQNFPTGMAQQRDGNHDGMMDLSSAAALTRSLASHDIPEPGKALFAGELILDDTSDQDRREASFLLKSESSQDIWIQFHLAWEGTPEMVELWVNTLSEAATHQLECGTLSQSSSIRRNSKQLHWEQPEHLEYSQTETTICMSSAFLKGNSKSVVTLIYRDESLSEISAGSTVLVGDSGSAYHSRYLQGTGVLTMQARPDDGLSHQLLIRLKKLDRCIKASPSNIAFPESELTTMLQQDVIIQNRISTSIGFTAKITETVLGYPMESSRVAKDDFDDKVGKPTELLLPLPVQIPDAAVDSAMSVNPASGSLDGHASMKIKVFCRPLNYGTKSCTLHLQSSSCLEETKIGITMMPKKGHLIHVPDLPDGVTLDMGFYFINSPSVEKVVPLKLQNLARDPVLLTFRSNLAKQVYICSSSNGSRRTDELQMSGGATSTVFMCLRPGGDVTAFEGGKCREIIGGMRITAHAISAAKGNQAGRGGGQNGIVDEIMVKFHAMVGRSLLQVSSSMIDLGRVNKIGGFVVGHFWVSNPSSQMPLHFSLHSERAQLSTSEGHLDGKDTTKLNGVPVVSEMAVKFSLPASRFGLVEDKIIVRNLFCTGQHAELVVRLFVNGGVVEGCPELLLPHFQRDQVKKISSLLGPTLDFPPRSRKSGRINRRSSHLLKTSRQASSLGSSAGDESENSSDRKIRKASSAGEFLFAKLALPMQTGNVAVHQQGSIYQTEFQETAPFVSNSFLHLGTVFVAPDTRTQTVQSAKAPACGDAVRYLISDFRPYHCSVLITNLLQEAIVLQPFSNLHMHVAVEENILTTHLTQKKETPSSGALEDDLFQVSPLNQSYTDVDPEMDAYCCSRSNGSAYESLTNDIAFELVTNLSSCGRPFPIQPSCATRLFVSYLDLKQPSSFDLACLAAGKVCEIEGLLVFIKCKSSAGKDNPDVLPDRYYETEDAKYIQIGCQAVEVFNIRGSICVSWGKLVKSYVQLGKVGHANRWADVEFEFTMENISDAILVYELVDVPDCFSIVLDGLQADMDNNERKGCVAPRKCSTLKVTLCTSKLDHVKQAGGPCSWSISLLNCNNPGNLMQLFVAAEMTMRNLRFEGLTEGALLVPPLTVPRLQNAPPCTMQFVVENLSREPLVVALQLQQTEETESLITLEVVSKTNTAVGELTLEPRGKVELRISASPISDIIPSPLLAQHPSFKRTALVGTAEVLICEEISTAKEKVDYMFPVTEALQGGTAEQTAASLDTKGSVGDLKESSLLISKVCLGQLYLFSSPHSPDCIPIHGALLQGSSFDVSPHSLHLQPKITLKEGPVREAWMERHDKSGCSQIVVIRNFRAFEALQFKVFPTDIEENVISGLSLDCLLVRPMKGSISPGESAEILVGALPWSRDAYETFMDNCASKGVGPETLTLTLHVQDSESQEFEGNLQHILVSIQPPSHIQEPVVEGFQAPSKPLLRDLDRTVSNTVFPSAQTYKGRPIVLGLLGCTPVEGNLLCYEFNLGQQNISSGGRLHWDLTLVGDRYSPVNYRLSIISEGYASWLSISNSSGVVEADEQKIVRLSFSTKAMGVYSTYLVVENLENPSDFKTVHLSLEVVALRNSRPEASSLSYFHVQVDGGRAEGTVIDMGEVYYNFWYRNRSFVVVNDAQVAMEFLLSSSLDENESTELNFSLANTSLKRFSSVTLGSKSSVRIWIHFCPGPSKDKPITEDTDTMSENIFINCRLVKDYRQCIPFRAKCRCPQISISTTDIVFSTRRRGQIAVANLTQADFNLAIGRNDSENRPVNPPLIENGAAIGSSGVPVELVTYTGESGLEVSRDILKPSGLSSMIREDDMELLPQQDMLIIRNLSPNRTLHYVVKNDSQFFTADVPETGIVSSCSRTVEGKEVTSQSSGSGQSFHVIIVKPNMRTLLRHQKSVLKQKYVEEHLTVYNRFNPREKYTISLRITAGHLRNFFADPGSKNSYPFSRLEVLITGFLSVFQSLTSHMQYNLSFQTEGPRQGVKETSKEGGLGPGRPVKQGELSIQHEFQALERLLGSWICGQVSADYDYLFFEFHYLTDELVFYCLKERWSRGGATLELATVQLAKLLYCALYRSKIFQLCLSCCQYYTSDDFTTSSSLPQGHTTTAGTEEGPVAYSASLHAIPSRTAGLEQPSATGPSESLDNPSVLVSSSENCLHFLEDWTGQLRHFLSFFPDSRDDLIPLRELSQENQVSIDACRAALDRKQQFFLYR